MQEKKYVVTEKQLSFWKGSLLNADSVNFSYCQIGNGVRERVRKTIDEITTVLTSQDAFNEATERIFIENKQLIDLQAHTIAVQASRIKYLEDALKEQEANISNMALEIATHEHNALLWSMVDSPVVRNEAQKMLDKLQEENTPNIDYGGYNGRYY